MSKFNFEDALLKAGEAYLERAIENSKKSTNAAVEQAAQAAVVQLPKVPTDIQAKVDACDIDKCAKLYEQLRRKSAALDNYKKALEARLKRHVCDHRKELLGDGHKSYSYDGTGVIVTLSEKQDVHIANPSQLNSTFEAALVLANPANEKAIKRTLDPKYLQNDPKTNALKAVVGLSVNVSEYWSIKVK